MQLLDHGYLTHVESWGSDQRIIESARMSTDKGFLGWGPVPICSANRDHSLPNIARIGGQCSVCGVKIIGASGDEKLLRYLYENKHSTPFEFAGMTIEVQAPLMVFREWHRHRVPFGYSEQSARYVEMEERYYVPSAERLAMGGQSKTNKQASGAALDDAVVKQAGALIRVQCEEAFKAYRILLANGVAKELARLVLPVNTYSRMRATGNLRGWIGFLTLRTAPGAQWEIRQYANAVGELISAEFPRTWELFLEGRAK